MDNYFNYFTEIENYFQTRRESFTLLSTLDWVLIETWKDQGVPLGTILRGMDRAFSKSKRRISSLAYCVHAINEVAEEEKDLRSEEAAPPEFSEDEIRNYLDRLGEAIRGLALRFPEFQSRIEDIARLLGELEAADLRSMENALGALEEKLVAIVSVATPESDLIGVREQVQKELAPFRSKMTVEQLAMLEQQLWKRKLMETHGVPRLSLFYLI